MIWPEKKLVLGIFKERLHRFGAMVQVRGRLEYCHVTNSGRLKELLYPGAKVALVDHFSQFKIKAGRKTRYAVRLAYYLNKWVCIEANIAPKLLREAWRKGKIPDLAGYNELKAEVPLDAHTRFDFQARNTRTGRTAWIEVKCVTLVDAQGVGRFPDAPSERASKHLRELMRLASPGRLKKVERARRGQPRCFVFFILQNPHGKAVGPKDDTDPLFGKTIRQAAQSKVRLRAWRAEVSLKGSKLQNPVPILL
jgi:sugar fermentation stimulation protein A